MTNIKLAIDTKKYLDNAVEYYSKKSIAHIKSCSLINGVGTMLLLKSSLTSIKPNIKNEIVHDVSILIKKIENQDAHIATYCNGIAGIGWLLLYLEQKGIIDIDSDNFFIDIDMFLEKEMNHMFTENNFDILHGYLGIGLYFLKKGENNQVEKIIEKLYDSSHCYKNEILWESTDISSDKKKYYDFGLAHGNASILYFLTKSHQKGVQKKKCRYLINGLIKFFLNNLQSPSTMVSFFPNKVITNSYKSPEQQQHSRLGWCYGDLGILNTLYLCADHLKLNSLKEKITSLLLQTTERKNPYSTLLDNPFFCHGTAGSAYIYLSLYLKTQKKQFLLSSEHLIKATLDFLQNKKTTTQVDFFREKMPTTDFLNGLPGVMLVLDSYLCTQNQTQVDWDEMSFIS